MGSESRKRSSGRRVTAVVGFVDQEPRDHPRLSDLQLGLEPNDELLTQWRTPGRSKRRNDGASEGSKRGGRGEGGR